MIRRTEIVWMVLAALLMVFVQTRDYYDARVTEKMRDEAVHRAARHYAGIVAHCANGGGFSIEETLVFCDPHTIRVANRESK